jgi:tRNA threonylcarbamoyladenosine biosynthesis protein TsaE
VNASRASSWELFAPVEADTRRAGAELAGHLGPGDLVLLTGELGSGKTAFVKGLAQGLGADPEEVSSPTFALVHEYGPPGRPPVLLHADFYRLADEGGAADLSDLGLDERGAAVLAIEWPRPPYSMRPGWQVAIHGERGGVRRIVIGRRMSPR